MLKAITPVRLLKNGFFEEVQYVLQHIYCTIEIYTVPCNA